MDTLSRNLPPDHAKNTSAPCAHPSPKKSWAFKRQWGFPAFQVYGGLLFGLPLAVTSFNRFSRLVESLARRLVYVLCTMYFDDANITDWRSSKGSCGPEAPAYGPRMGLFWASITIWVQCTSKQSFGSGLESVCRRS